MLFSGGHIKNFDCFRHVPRRKWTLNPQNELKLVRTTLFHATCYSTHIFGQKKLVNFDFFGTFSCFRFVNLQLFGLFDQLNAQAGLSNEPRNIPCATGQLPGPLGPNTAQRRPRFLHRRSFGLSDLRGHLEITSKSESPMKMDTNRTAACSEHVRV